MGEHDCVKSLMEAREKDQEKLKFYRERENDFMLNFMPKMMAEYNELEAENAKLIEKLRVYEAKE